MVSVYPLLLNIIISADIVFFIFLYQRWIYRVDPKRVNEFGTSGEPMVGSHDDDPPLTDDQKKDN